jgi:flagellar biosynthesis/type III secretory pathway M-ring protein FliF/YscJ
VLDAPPFSYWFALPNNVRLAALAALAAIVIAAGAFSFTRDVQTPLFARPLLADQLADVETHLAAWNVPFATTADNVEVAAKHRSEILLRLSLAGVPRPHIADSTETLAKVGALTPQSVLDEQTRDGLAGDLALGLRGITGIADARVIVAPANPGYFADQSSHEASASVRLTLEPGAQLSPETINGIKTFVAAGVPGLEPSHVAVVDDRGVALNGQAETGDAQATALQTSIQTALDQVVGPGHAIVRAHVDVDPRTNVQVETKRTPLGKPLSNTSFSERYQNGAKHYAKTQSTADGGSDVVQSETESVAGAPQRVSIAVFLDQSLAPEIPRIRSLVESSAGINYARGDTVTVQPIALAAVAPGPAAAPGAATAAASASASATPVKTLLATFLPALPPLIIALAWAGLLLLLARPIAGAVRAMLPAPVLPPGETPVLATGLAPEEIHRALSGEPPYTAATVIAGLPTPTAAAVLDLYPSDVRREIIGRLARPRSPLGADLAESVAHA